MLDKYIMLCGNYSFSLIPYVPHMMISIMNLTPTYVPQKPHNLTHTPKVSLSHHLEQLEVSKPLLFTHTHKRSS